MELLENCELYSQGKTCSVGPWRKKIHKSGTGYAEFYREMPRGLFAGGLGESDAYGAPMVLL